jgi:hypothetical protein
VQIACGDVSFDKETPTKAAILMARMVKPVIAPDFIDAGVS